METPLIPLTASQEESVLEGVNYSRSSLSEDLASLKTWLSQQHHFPPSANQEPDAFFCNFLVGCKGDMNRAKTKIDNYYKYRSRAKDFCSDRDPMDPKCVATWPHFFLLTLPRATPDGCRVTLSISGVPDYPDYDPAVIAKRMIYILEMRMRTEPIQCGEYILLDSANFSTSYLFHALRPTFLRNIIYFMQNVMPWRIRGIISLNTPSYLQVAINRVIKPLMKQKIAKRIHVYTEGPEVLSKHFPSEMLPNDYGGRDDPIRVMSDKWMESASSPYWREWFNTKGVETVQEESDNNSRGFLTSFWGVTSNASPNS